MDPILERYQALENKIKAYNPNLDTQRLFEAFAYADKAHAGQLRKDGSPYITHPLAVADNAADMELDTDSIIAALLHDTVEDTDATYEDVAKHFGKSVAELVDGVTKLAKVKYVSKEEEQVENLRKMLMAMAKDIRVVLIKICDRLHNMRTMQFQTPRKQREKALETMEIYAPLAHRLGMQRVKWELEDTSIRYLDPVGYKEIVDELERRSAAHEEFMASIQKKIEDRLAEEGIEGKVYGRIKHAYSIYRKMYNQNKTMDEIYDLYAFRVIVKDVPACYNVLCCIHDLFKPVLGRFKDYIGTPKPNGYQSLHTTVIGREGLPFEVQIRTEEMHNTAEYGIAAHWKYKQGMANEKLGTEEAFEWVRKLLEAQQDTDAEEFLRSMRVDLFADQVFVYTPKGDIFPLPAGATPIDFAYSIHSAVGNHMTGAKVNGRMVPFDTQLQNGQIVEIITSPSAHGPSRDWMKICKSNEARNKIRQWFKKERQEENIVTGRASFESELRHMGIKLSTVLEEEVQPRLLKKARFNTMDELYATIGYGGVTAQKVVLRMKDELDRIRKAQRNPTPENTEETLPMLGGQRNTATAAAVREAPTHSKTGIVVEGLDNCLVKFAKCCTPVPGDPVVGFITRGYGVSVHRADCPNCAPEKRKPEEAGRWVKVAWVESDCPGYNTAVTISAKDRPGLMMDLSVVLSDAKVQVTSFQGQSMPDGYANFFVVLAVKDCNELNSVLNRLRQVRNVYQVKRAGT